jgi:hypothetical protein
VPARRQGRQILLNDEPDSDDINSVVFMPQMVAQPLDLSPRHSRAQFPACVTEFLGRLTDNEQGVFDGVKGLVVPAECLFLAECLKVHACNELLNPRDVFKDILETLDRIARRHARPRRPRYFTRAV